MRCWWVAVALGAGCVEASSETRVEAFGAVARADTLLVTWQRFEAKLRTSGDGESAVLGSASGWASLGVTAGVERAGFHAVFDDTVPEDWSVPFPLPVALAEDGTGWMVFETRVASGNATLWPAPGGAETAEPLADEVCSAAAVALSDGGLALAARRVPGEVVLYVLDAAGVLQDTVALDLPTRTCDGTDRVAMARRGEQVAVAARGASGSNAVAVYVGDVAGAGASAVFSGADTPAAVWLGPSGPRVLAEGAGTVTVLSAGGTAQIPTGGLLGCVASGFDATGRARVLYATEAEATLSAESAGGVVEHDLAAPGLHPTACAIAGGEGATWALWYANDPGVDASWVGGPPVLHRALLDEFGLEEQDPVNLAPSRLVR